MNQLILLGHVFFGVACVLCAAWVFVETLHTPSINKKRINMASRLGAVVMWVSFLIGGYWYVTFYKADKTVILKGPWSFAHGFFMETKEHLVITLLLLATFLPIATANDLTANAMARRLVLWTSGAVALLALLMEGEGAIIALGVKVALLSK
jgi:hypothetical protein